MAIYGLIVAIVFSSKIEGAVGLTESSYATGTSSPYHHCYIAFYCIIVIIEVGYALFWAGLSVGLTDLACGITVGYIGAMTAIADAQDRAMFVKILVIEIFASAIGIFGLIVGFVQAAGATVDL